MQPIPLPIARQRAFAVCLLAVVSACESNAPQTEPDPAAAVRPGIQVLLTDSLRLIAGRRIGLITNQTGVDRNETSSIDLLFDASEAGLVSLFSLFSPEHGIRGEIRGGEAVEGVIDQATGLPVHSLYGTSLRPTAAMLAELDAILFDLQDIGARYYTYVSTMAYAMEAAGEAGIPFIVLDRPNPIGGLHVQGNVLEPEHATFVGLYAVPMRHGMTPGELAGLYRGHFGVEVDLHIVPADGWERDLWFDQTGLPWIPPSPNMPSLESATHYPGTCLFEGTNLSVGRGTPWAFQVVGAPWLDADDLAERLNAHGLPGVRFEPELFTPRNPSDGKFPDIQVHGVRLRTTDREVYDPTVAAVAILLETRRRSRDRWEWSPGHFDRLAGTTSLRAAVDAGTPLEEITGTWESSLSAFRELREAYLLY